MTNKEIFIKLVRENITRNGIEKLLEFLEKTDFYTAPASTKYHDACEGGLCDHSIRVFLMMIDEEGLVPLELRDKRESIAVVSLFHDLCKVGFYTVSTRNVKNNETGKWTQEPYYAIDDKYPLGHGNKSLDMLRDFIEVSTEERLAITHHMGLSPNMSYGDSEALSKTYNENTLALLLHVADMKASYMKG